jgi:hypothetical protein
MQAKNAPYGTTMIRSLDRDGKVIYNQCAAYPTHLQRHVTAWPIGPSPQHNEVWIMRQTRYVSHGWLVVVVLAATLLLAACQSPIDDPYGAGQQFRQIVDVFLEDFSEFMEGFCGTPPAALLAGLALLLYAGRRPI